MAPYTRLVVMSLAMLPVISGVYLIQPYVVKLAIDTALLTGDKERLLLLCCIYVSCLLTEFLLRYAQNYVTQIAGQRTMFDLREKLFGHLLELSPAYYDRHPVGRVMTRVTTDVEALNELFSSGVVAILSDLVTLVGIFIALSFLEPWLALLALVSVPVLLPLIFFIRARMRDTFTTTKVMMARMNAYLSEAVSGIRVVQLFNREERCSQEFNKLNESYRQAFHKTNIYEAFLYSGVELAGSITVALMVWHGGGQILQDVLTFGVLVAAVDYTQKLFAPIRDLSSKFAILQGAMASAERVFKVLDSEPEIQDPEYPVSLEGSSVTVQFDHVSFAYRDGPPVMSDVSFQVSPGERVAIVGATGAGKTTLMKLLCRFYDVTGGAVRLNGIDVRMLSGPELHRTVRVMLQDIFMITGTLRDNVTLGHSGVPDEVVLQALRQVHGMRLLERLGGGLDGRIRERGANLSMGERQLVSLARLLVLNPSVLILDEATSSVDTETERLVQEAIETVMRGRSTLIIAHRLSTTKTADRILVMHHGHLREEGTHAELLALRGIYHRLYELQYRDQEEEEKREKRGHNT